MPAPNVVAYSNKYKFGRGRLFYNKLRSNGSYEGFRPLGNCPGFVINVESEKFEHFSSEGGLREKDLEVTTQINRTAEITCDNMSNENLELFLAATASTRSQGAGTVTDEVIAAVQAARIYQLGVTAPNPAGVRGITAVSVSAAQGDAAIAWTATTAKVVGDVVRPTTANGRWYVATVAGTTAGTQPTFPTNGGTVVDGTVTWQDMGLIIYTVTTDYLVDLALGLLSVNATGAIATAASRMPAGLFVNLNVDYTRTANSRTEIGTTGSAELVGQLLFIADNPQGDQQDCLMPSVTLSPSGELPFITENELASVTFAVGINVRDSQTSAIYINGRPA
jgi:hypothetical protein